MSCSVTTDINRNWHTCNMCWICFNINTYCCCISTKTCWAKTHFIYFFYEFVLKLCIAWVFIFSIYRS